MDTIAIFLILSASFILTAAELRLHFLNKRYIELTEAPRYSERLAYLYYWLARVTPVLLFGEYFFLHGVSRMPVLGLILILTSVALRVWSLHSLGYRWFQGCWLMMQREYVKVGPYRLLRHPEYHSRLFECLGFMLLLGSFWLGSLCLVVLFSMALVLARREDKLRRMPWLIDDMTAGQTP